MDPKSGQTYTWDEENRLVSAKRTSDNVVLGSYKYDALGRRVQKTSSEGTRTYVLSGAQVVQEYLGTVLERSYVYGTYVDEVLVQVSGAGVKNYFHTNHLYSTAALTNSAGAVVERYGYDAYGKRVTMDADGTAKSGNAVTTVGFTGRTLDSETGLWYFRARYFSEGLNRFIGRDPHNLGKVKGGLRDGNNRYCAYMIPKSLDPTGMYEGTGDDQSRNKGVCCTKNGQVEYDRRYYCCKKRYPTQQHYTLEYIIEICIYSIKGGLTTSGYLGHSFISVTYGENDSIHHTYGYRRGGYAVAPYTTRPGVGGMHVDYEKKQYKDKGLPYPGSKRCKKICGPFSVPGTCRYGVNPSPGEHNCASFAAKMWEMNTGENLDTGVGVPNPSGLTDSIDELNNEDNNR